MFRKFAAAERAAFIALLTFVAATSPVFAQLPEAAPARQSAASAVPADAGPRLRESMPRVEAGFKDEAMRRSDHKTTITISTVVLIVAIVVLVLVLVM